MVEGRICPTILAARWAAYGGDTPWTHALEAFAVAGGMAMDWGGVPRSKSAISLTFSLYLPDGSKLENNKYRLKDIRRAVALAVAMGRPE
jgi:hypothetical protein